LRVALVNTNRIQPPIAPIGLEYVAEALGAAGHHVEVLDLCWAADPSAAIARFFGGPDFGLVGITLRNTDDCAFTSRQSFLDEFAGTVHAVRERTDAPIVLGGVGFSVMPEQVLVRCEAEAGVWGEGEFAMVALAQRVARGEAWHDVPNLVWRGEDGWQRNAPSISSLADLPTMSRRWLDNRRYFREGGQAGFETKRGCPGQCIYCADPLAKGRVTRTRPPEAVVDELANLLALGIDHLHTCDSEFNLPEEHAMAICREIVRRGLGGRLRWYAYCAPAPFSGEVAWLMREAGCVGVNFGADHGDATMLRRLGRAFTPEDILAATRRCREAGMAVMLDLLLGAPGETREGITRTIELMQRAAPERVGISLGVRVYPGTRLAEQVMAGGREGLIGGEDPAEPLFFLDPEVAPDAFGWVDDLVGDDRRFLFFDPSKPTQNYNYNANQRLVEAIAEGYRGAYWDILRRYE
jgi:tryptophan 2-C-methyltransferase